MTRCIRVCATSACACRQQCILDENPMMVVRLTKFQSCCDGVTCHMVSNYRGINATADRPRNSCSCLSPLMLVARVCIPPPRSCALELVGQKFTAVCVEALSHTPKKFALHPTSTPPPHLSPHTSHVVCCIDQTGALSSSRAHLWLTLNATHLVSKGISQSEVS